MKEKILMHEGHVGAVFPVVSGRHYEHSHEELELDIVHSGTARYLIDGMDYPIQSGSILWLLPEQEHLLADTSPDFVMYVLLFRPEKVAEYCREEQHAVLRQRTTNTPLCRILPMERFQQFTQMCELLVYGNDGMDYRNAAMHYLLLEAWQAFEESSIEPPGMALHPAVFRAAQLIAQGEDDLQRVASFAGLSFSRLSRTFSGQMGQSMTDYRNQQRLERFKLLRSKSPDEGLLNLALEAGFGSYAQFHRVYRKHYGKTPRENDC